SLMLQSDQAQSFNQIMNQQEISSISTVHLKRWFEFSKIIDKESEILAYIAEFGNQKMLDKYCKTHNKTKNDLEQWRDSKGKPFLHLVIEKNNYDLADLLIKEGLNINVQDKQGNVPLHIAVMTGNVRAFKSLIVVGANQEIENKSKLIPIQKIVELKEEYFKKFIELGADLNAKNSRGFTAIYRAIEIGDMDALKGLINAGANVDIQDNEGNSLLHFAAGSDKAKALQILIEAGAKVEVYNKTNESFFDVVQDDCDNKTIHIVNEAIEARLKKENLREDVTIISANQTTAVIQENDAQGRIYTEDGVVKARANSIITERTISTISTNSDNSALQSDTDSLEAVKRKFLSEIDRKYVRRNLKVKKKAIKYIDSVKEGMEVAQEYKEYEDGQARKGISSKFAGLLKGIRKTDNDMIQEITKQFKSYAKDPSKQITLPSRYNLPSFGKKSDKGQTKQ
ncbi:MAG: ankyrin repeat domain-containing protein, partial [Rickettsiales bacterium]